MDTKPLKILWVKAGPLHPLDKGGNIRTYNMLKLLKTKHSITYLSFIQRGSAEEIKKLSEEYADSARWVEWSDVQKKGFEFYAALIKNLFFSELPYAIEKYKSPSMKKIVEECDSSGKFDLIVCDFLSPSVNFPETLKTSTILFQHNVESMIWRRHVENQRKYLSKAYFTLQWERMLRYEKIAGSMFDGVITVSKKDSEILKNNLGYDNIIGDVPTGVDTEYFKPQGLAKKKNSIVFSGSMDWMPNEDAVIYFVKEIYPRIKSAVPDVSFTIVGRNPGANILSIAGGDKSITVTGTVEDVRPHIERAEAYVVPLRIGSGTRIKILEAMAMAMPIVSTTIGAEGLPLSNNGNILNADSPGIFSEAVIEILKNNAKRTAICDKNRQSVKERFGWKAVASEFEKLIMGAAI